MKQKQAWKVLERYIARLLGGKRNYRGADFSESACDVEHSTFSIECKYRSEAFKQIYDYMEQAKQYDGSKLPLVALRRKGRKALIVMEAEDFARVYAYMEQAQK